jgi:hypothetical protein
VRRLTVFASVGQPSVWAGRDFSREEVRRYEDLVGRDPDAALAHAVFPLAEVLAAGEVR